VGNAEQRFVQENLALVNERRVAAGYKPVDPTNPQDPEASKYGFTILGPELPSSTDH